VCDYGEGWFEEPNEDLIEETFEKEYDAAFEKLNGSGSHNKKCCFTTLNKNKVSKYELDDFFCGE